MPKDSGWEIIFASLPFKKLRRYEVANLTFDAMGLGFTVLFTLHQNGGLAVFLLWIAVLALSMACVMWASKQ